MVRKVEHIIRSQDRAVVRRIDYSHDPRDVATWAPGAHARSRDLSAASRQPVLDQHEGSREGHNGHQRLCHPYHPLEGRYPHSRTALNEVTAGARPRHPLCGLVNVPRSCGRRPRAHAAMWWLAQGQSCVWLCLCGVLSKVPPMTSWASTRSLTFRSLEFCTRKEKARLRSMLYRSMSMPTAVPMSVRV
jgi:hypothetical protein